MKQKRIVVATAGGHISAFHAGMLGMLDTLDNQAPGQFQLVGAWGGLQGLHEGNFVPILREHLEPGRAGSLIGADRRKADPNTLARTLRDKNIHAIVIMGGDNHMGEMASLPGIRVVGYPKTMDGDLGSLITLGWHTAVTTGSMQTRWHHHSAMTNRRVFFVGLFGRNTDWTVCGVTAYGGGDLGIPCEAEYDAGEIFERVAQAVQANHERYGIEFAVVPYAEGARLRGLHEPPSEHRALDPFGQPKLQPEWVGMELVRLAKTHGLRAAFQAHTYDLRDSPPTEVDQRLSRMAGTECIKMILDGDFSQAVVFQPDGQGFYQTARRAISEVAVQRRLSPTGFFDYETLKPTPTFVQAYGNLFSNPFGHPPAKDDLVYRNLLSL